MSKDKRYAILQLREIEKFMLEVGIPLTFRFMDPISPLVVSELTSKGYTISTEEKQIPEEYLTKNAVRKTRYLTRYFIDIK